MKLACLEGVLRCRCCCMWKALRLLRWLLRRVAVMMLERRALVLRRGGESARRADHPSVRQRACKTGMSDPERCRVQASQATAATGTTALRRAGRSAASLTEVLSTGLCRMVWYCFMMGHEREHSDAALRMPQRKRDSKCYTARTGSLVSLPSYLKAVTYPEDRCVCPAS